MQPWASMQLDGNNRSWGSRSSPDPGFALLVYIIHTSHYTEPGQLSSIKTEGSVFHS